MLPTSWSSGQSFWLLITRSRVRFSALPWGFSLWGRIPVVTMVWVVSRIRLKVETSITRSHKSINNDWIHERDLLSGGDLITQTAYSTSAYRVPSTLIADYGRERERKNLYATASSLLLLHRNPVNAKAIHVQTWTGPEGSKEVETPRFS